MSEILDRLGVGIAVGDHETRVLAANTHLAKILKRRPPDLIGLRMRDVTHPEDVALSDQLLGMARHTGHAVTLRKRYMRPSGQPVWVEKRIFVLDAAHGADPTFLMLSRRIAKPAVDASNHEPGELADYVAGLSRGLAMMARRAGLGGAEELLLLASQLAREEADR